MTQRHEVTPSPQAVRITGTLDTIRQGGRSFSLVLESGAVLEGVAESLAPAVMATFLGQQVVVTGMAVFQPSGSVLRIEADQIHSTSPQQASLWSRLPKPLFSPLDTVSLSVPQDECSGLNAIYGKWPGEESEEEILTALRDLS